MEVLTVPALPLGLPRPRDRKPVPPLALSASEIFQGRREVLLDFQGTQYRLRITRKNKLILQK